MGKDEKETEKGENEKCSQVQKPRNQEPFHCRETVSLKEK